MEKGTMNAKGVFFALQSEKGHRFYKRTFVSERGSKITERGITWLGAVKTHRNMFGKLRKLSFTLNIGFTWMIVLVAILQLLVGALLRGLWQGIKWIARKIGRFFAKLWNFFCLIKAWCFRSDYAKQHKEKENRQGIWWTMAIILLAILFCWFYRSFVTVEPDPLSAVAKVEYYDETDTEWNNTLYEGCIYDACRLKGYLDGFQTKAQPIGNGRYVLLLGVSEQNGKWIGKDACVEKSDIYPKMKEYIQSKKSVFTSSVRKRLSAQEMIALQLVHLRMGTTGFCGKLSDGSSSRLQNGSELIKALNNAEIVDKLFRLPETTAENDANQESLKYFWVLYQIYCGNLSVEEIYSFPMQSYLNIPLSDMYEDDVPVWNESLAKRLTQGTTQSFKASGVMPD